jgi:uncharacterized protein
MNFQQHHSLSFFRLLTFLFAILLAIPATLASPPSPQAPTTTVSDLESRAENGEAAAQYRLGVSILKRNNLSPEDIQTALKWLRASAGQNNPNAAFYLGYLYEHGRFVARDYRLAFQNYEIAAKLQYSPAENNLGSLYQHGQGVTKNVGKAFEWYLASAQHGDAVGQMNLASVYYLGSGVQRDYKETVHWLRHASDSNLPEAENCLAYFYFYGVTVQRDYDEAARLVRLAAQQGLPSAETNLGYLYETGKGIPLDYVAAYTWYSRAISAGDNTGADHRKDLQHIMTQKQLDEAHSMTTAFSSPAPAVPTLPGVLQPSLPNPGGLSLLNAQH